MNEWVQFGLVFLVVTAVALALVMLVQRRNARAQERLRRAQEDPEGDHPQELILGSMTPALAGQIPMTAKGKSELQRELWLAGYYRPVAFMEYAAVRALLVLLPLLATGVALLLVPSNQFTRVLTIGALAVLLGYSLPRVYLYFRGRARARQIERGLPLAIDLLTLCLTAGQNLLAALKQVSEELAFSHPALARELAIAHRQAELHSLEQAMKQWADRVPVPEVKNLALLLVQSERLGTDAASTLLELSNNMRATLRQRAEAQANRTSFWMLFPSVFCFWVAAAIILVGPPYLEFFHNREKSAQFFNQSRKIIDGANDRTIRSPSGKVIVPAQPPTVTTPDIASQE
jgi:pilus assembly protein TadC